MVRHYLYRHHNCLETDLYHSHPPF
jgi:hypothetical protein